MPACLINIFNSFITPFVLLVIGEFGATIHALHLLFENGTIKRFSLATLSSTTTFHHSGATERAREQIRAVTPYIGDGETADSFLDNIETRIHKLWNDSLGLSLAQLRTGSVEVSQLAQGILQSVALNEIHRKDE